MKKVYNKLVRDNIIDIIIKNNGRPTYRVLDDKEYWEYLLKKDEEELLEVKNAIAPDEVKKELADKLELIIAMALYHGYTLEDIKEEAKLKREKNGAFKERLLLEEVEK